MDPSKRPVTILWNSGAGWDKRDQVAEAVQESLTDASKPGFESKPEFVRLKKGEDIIARAHGLVDEGSRILVAAGGDGTINAVASALVNSPATLAVIPAGTLNHFARDLEIPLDPETAALSIKDGHEIMVDVASVNDRIFINNSVLGVYPIYRAAREAYERKGLGGSRIGRFFAVLRGIIRVFVRLPHLKLRLQLDSGKVVDTHTPFVLVANNEHEVEDWNIGHRQSLDQGCLYVYVMRPCSRWAIVRFIAGLLIKRFSRAEAFQVFRTRSVRIETRSRTLRVGVDGEIVRMKTPLEYRSIPKSLRVIAPAHYLPEPAQPQQLAETEA